jgi:hypothetical protein
MGINASPFVVSFIITVYWKGVGWWDSDNTRVFRLNRSRYLAPDSGSATTTTIELALQVNKDGGKRHEIEVNCVIGGLLTNIVSRNSLWG